MGNRKNKFIITLTGPSACGKSYLIEYICTLGEELGFKPKILPKYVTRSPRASELRDQKMGKELEIIPVPKIPEECEYRYQMYGKQYGFDRDAVRAMLEEGLSPIIVVNEVRVVEELKRDFKDQVLSLFVFRSVPRLETFEQEAQKRGVTAIEEIQERLSKSIAIYRTYVAHIALFNRVILNPPRRPDQEDYAKTQIKNVLEGVLKEKIPLSRPDPSKPKLFIIAGNAASGKDEIIRAVNDMGKRQAKIIRKYTSRRKDEDDGEEMICKDIPRLDKLEEFGRAYQAEVEEHQRLAAERNAAAGEDTEKLVELQSRNLREEREILTAEERFWQTYYDTREQKLRERICCETSGNADVRSLRREIEEQIHDAFFMRNEEYIDLEKIREGDRFASKRKVSRVKYRNRGYVFYENNATLYGFEIYNSPRNAGTLLREMEKQNKHAVLVASLVEIFDIVRPLMDGNIVTIFSYSEISADEFEKHSKAGTADKKMTSFEAAIKEYSDEIVNFDHVTLFAESELGKRNSVREEELIDQMFRLFRHYLPAVAN